ncbi:MAG: tyrosine-type recombinase/integrase [Actinomycetota bacterium]
MGYESLLRRHVLPAFGDYPLGRIDTLQIREWVAQMSAAGLSRDSVRQAKQVLWAILTLAVEANYIARNPCQGIKLGKGAKQEKCFLTDAQVVALAQAIAPLYSTLVYFLAYSGLRWGEAAALRRRRCDLAHSRVGVAEALSEARGFTSSPPRPPRPASW